MPRKKAGQDWLKRAPQSTNFESIEAFFRGHGYEPHRHDTYAIGRTLAGVQSFNYRHSMRHGLPGRTLVLHPDEVHDGQAGTPDGFRYRMIYIEPAFIQQILGGKSLPFIPDGISSDPRLFRATERVLNTMEVPLEPLEEDDALVDLAQALDAVAGQRPGRSAFDYQAAERARDYIHSTYEQRITLDDLALACGRDRWSLTRDFRALYGTSPYRYVTMRRLDHCRRLMLAGLDLVDASLTAGFSDQSHMTRHFVSTYGLTPARWLRMLVSR